MIKKMGGIATISPFGWFMALTMTQHDFPLVKPAFRPQVSSYTTRRGAP
jgi:hypothetical protein